MVRSPELRALSPSGPGRDLGPYQRGAPFLRNGLTPNGVKCHMNVPETACLGRAPVVLLVTHLLARCTIEETARYDARHALPHGFAVDNDERALRTAQANLCELFRPAARQSTRTSRTRM